MVVFARNKHPPGPISEQTASGFSFSSNLVRGVHARASVERRGKRGRQSRAWTFACLGRFAQRTKKKERLLVVQFLKGLIELIHRSLCSMRFRANSFLLQLSRSNSIGNACYAGQIHGWIYLRLFTVTSHVGIRINEILEVPVSCFHGYLQES